MYNRWYDKYPELKYLLSLLETVDEYHIELIAQDFLQIILNKYGQSFDEFIKKISDNAPENYKRWYDKNYNIHTCIEFIKIIDDNEKEELINSFIISLLSIMANEYDGK